jgi:predicted fused transcriptional regulator/phosphomethylpyrimidine kinase
VACGTLQALSKNPRADIIIYHKGDIGKEPMIITVFGKNPRKVAAKIKEEILKNYWTLLAAPESLCE